MKDLLKKLILKHELNREDITKLIDKIIKKEISDIQIGAFISLLTQKKETINELVYLIENIKKYVTKFPINDNNLIDIVGTGGDGFNTLNISTLSSLLVASTGIKVAKHGNRSVSSKCGSADLLESYGIDLSINKVVSHLENVGITFIYAPEVNPVYKNISHIRKDLGFRSCFNILGPFLNPLPIKTMLLGVFHKDLLDKAVLILKNLNYKRAMVVNCCGLDEITTIGKTDYRELNNGIITSGVLDPIEYGFTIGKIEDLVGGAPEKNKKIINNFISEPSKYLTLKETIIFNAGVAIYLTGKKESIKEGCIMAQKYLENREIAIILKNWINNI